MTENCVPTSVTCNEYSTLHILWSKSSFLNWSHRADCSKMPKSYEFDASTGKQEFHKSKTLETGYKYPKQFEITQKQKSPYFIKTKRKTDSSISHKIHNTSFVIFLQSSQKLRLQSTLLRCPFLQQPKISSKISIKSSQSSKNLKNK